MTGLAGALRKGVGYLKNAFSSTESSFFIIVKKIQTNFHFDRIFGSILEVWFSAGWKEIVMKLKLIIEIVVPFWPEIYLFTIMVNKGTTEATLGCFFTIKNRSELDIFGI